MRCIPAKEIFFKEPVAACEYPSSLNRRLQATSKQVTLSARIMLARGWYMARASSPAPRTGGDLMIGFVAGVLAVAVFHQLAVFAFGYVGLSAGEVYSFRPTTPFGVPRIMSQMFWGGVWGIVFALVFDRLPERWPLVAVGFLFSLCGPVLFDWTVVAALRGHRLFDGLNPTRMLASVLINGSFGIGLALIFSGLRRFVRGRPRPA